MLNILFLLKTHHVFLEMELNWIKWGSLNKNEKKLVFKFPPIGLFISWKNFPSGYFENRKYLSIVIRLRISLRNSKKLFPFFVKLNLISQWSLYQIQANRIFWINERRIRSCKNFILGFYNAVRATQINKSSCSSNKTQVWSKIT